MPELPHELTSRHLGEIVAIQALDTFGHALVVCHCCLLRCNCFAPFPACQPGYAPLDTFIVA